MQRLLKGIPAFASLPAVARAALAAHLQEQSYPKHAVVLDEGEPADRLFLIEDGDVEVSMKTALGRVPLCCLSQGEMFGEIGLLLSSRKRTARVTATTPLITLTLKSRHLNEILDQHPDAREVMIHAADQAMIRSFVKSTLPFERLTPERLKALAERLKPTEFAQGAVVFQQGDHGDSCYLVRSGAVEVIRDEANGARRVATLEAGDIVGESAVLTSTPRDATLRAVGPTVLLALRRADFIETLDSDRRIGDHVVDLMRLRDRPRAKAGVVLHPQPTASGETIWVLADPSRLGAYHRLSGLGLFVWHRLDGDHTGDEIAALYRDERGEVWADDIARIMAELVQAGFAKGKELDAAVASVLGPPLAWWERWWQKMVGGPAR